MNRTDTQAARLLREAHIRHLFNLGACSGNLGWVVTEDAYLSKTRVGVVKTKRVGFRQYEHTAVAA